MQITDTTSVESKLDVLGFKSTNEGNSPLVFVSELGNRNSNLSPFHILELENAKSFRATAVFFRYFEDSRPPLPQVYIYDNIGSQLNKEYSIIHKELWSSCIIPSFIVIEETIIRIFDCRKPVKVDDFGNISTKEIARIDLEKLNDYSEVIEKYHASKFENGSFWESEEANKHYTYGSTAYSSLIDALKTLRSKHNSHTKLPKRLFDYVIIISTLIKFLEENGIDDTDSNHAALFFKEVVGTDNFNDVLLKGKLVRLIDALADKFNGGIFSVSNDDKKILREGNFEKLANFFDAKVGKNEQLVLWPQYSFKHIPIELISNIYEEFLPVTDKGAVYTPHYLVNFLIDECLPIPGKNIAAQTDKLRTVDVSCGSGIFLVNTFKRIVQLYKIAEYNRTGSFPKVGVQLLQRLIRENIFGIDVNRNAVELTKFSLQLALCQMLSPKQIWTELKFQDLGKANILQEDFFVFLNRQANKERFNYIIGNPPFNPPLGENGEQVKSANYYEDVISEYNIECLPVGDHNLALLFLQLSPRLLASEGLLCFIQPTIPLLHARSNSDFRSAFFAKYNVHQIIDFTNFRRVLFPTATVPTCAVFLSNELPSSTYTTHVVVRRTKPSKERLYFEIDSYDIHQIPFENISDNRAWKSNIFGGYRLYNLVQKLQAKPKIKEIATKKGVAITLFSKKVYKEISLTQHVILIKKEITHGEFPYIVDFDKANSETLIISGKREAVQQIVGYLEKESKALVSYIAGSSTRQGLDRPYNINKSDFENLPYFENNFLNASDLVLVDDISNFFISAFGNGENSPINKELRVYSVKIPSEMYDYAQELGAALTKVFSRTQNSFKCQNYYDLGSCFMLEFDNSKTAIETNEMEFGQINSKTIFQVKLNSSLLSKRILIMYNGTKISILKPKQKRYWLKSVALMDADKITADVISLNLKRK